MARRKGYQMVKAADLEHLDIIVDPEGHQATVYRVRMMDHQRARLETDRGVAVVMLEDTFATYRPE